MAILYKTTGEQIEVKPASPPFFSLLELQGFVGGSIEVVFLRGKKKRFMVIHGEGKLDGLPENPGATFAAIQSIAIGDFISGDALICDSTEID
jgi:hypothetical protein